MDRPDLLYSVKDLMRKMAPPRTRHLTALKRVARYTIKILAIDLRKPWTELDSNIEVFGDANFAGCNSTKIVGVLALSSGESEMVAVVRAATEGVGLQSISNDICVWGHVAIV